MTLLTPTLTIPLAADADGVVRVSKTRVTLDTLIHAFCQGASAEEIAQQYPSVPLPDIYIVLGYYMQRQADVDSYLAKRRQQAEVIRQQNEALHNPVGVRQRLLARRANGGR
jgi:uncharacterized protein (DUF433 family)